VAKSDKDRGGKAPADKAKAGKGKKKTKDRAVRPEAKALARSPSHLLHRALQLALDVYAAETGPGAVTQRQYAVLAAVAAGEHPSQTDLVRMTGIDRSTLAELVSRMMAKGLLGRERSASDGRANLVRLTDEGRAALDAAEPKVKAADARILGFLGGGKRAAFVEALAKLARAGELTLEAEERVAQAAAAKAKRTPAAGAEPASPPAKPKIKTKAKPKAKAKAATPKPRLVPSTAADTAAPKRKAAAKTGAPRKAPFEPPKLVVPE
jgi:DNA-binding MarR family transcriptional regulator